MLIILFVVAALFGIAAVALWAALASAKLRLHRGAELTDELLAMLADRGALDPTRHDELKLRRDEAFGS